MSFPLLRARHRGLGPLSRKLATVVALGTLAAASAAQGATLVRGPYLQLLTASSVTVVWNTDVPSGCSLALGPLDQVASEIASEIDGSVGTVCAIAVDGLTPGTQYAYVPRADGTRIADQAVFKTPDATRPFSFLVLGDSGDGGTAQLRVRDRLLATPADFILHTGDMVYQNGAAEDFDRTYFAPYRALLRRLVLWPCLGNHDVRTADGAPWLEAFHTPANNPAGKEHYYSFDFGTAHVAVLDSNRSTSPGSAQHLFLDQDLGASTALWKFVAFHHSIYSSGNHGSDLQIRANLVPLFDKHGVDVVLMGHDHHYERTLPLRADLVVEPGLGTAYITTGGGGAELYPVGANTFTAYAESAFHYTRVAVDGGTLLAQMIRDDGTIGDSLTLVKGEPPPAPRCGDGLVNQGAEECDGADHPACVGPCALDCTCAPACGDGVVNQPSEACETLDDVACPGFCLSDCACTDPALVVSLMPVADTYVESGVEAGWDHGASDRLEADASPASVIYLKFDLSGVPRFVARAMLSARCINASVNDATIYPVADSSWVEGTGTGIDVGSAGGPGLKWVDLDTNLDGKLDAGDTTPFLPEFGRWLGPLPCILGQASTVDVTAAFLTDAPLVSLAMDTDSSDGAGYASREIGAPSDRPQLRLELGELRPTTTITTTTTTSTTTTSTTTTLPSTTTTTRPPPVRCTTGSCNDGDPCTVDRCVEATGCAYDEAEGFAAVRCMFEGSRLEPPPCAGQPLAQAVTRAFGRAQSLVDRASVAPRVRQAKTKLRKAVRLLAKASRLVRAQGNLPVDCVVALGSILEEARIRAERLARTL